MVDLYNHLADNYEDPNGSNDVYEGGLGLRLLPYIG